MAGGSGGTYDPYDPHRLSAYARQRAYAQAREFGEKIDWAGAIHAVVDSLPLLELEKAALRREMATLLGTGGSVKAHWMPAPFPKQPRRTWLQERLLTLKRQVRMVGHLLRKKRRRRKIRRDQRQYTFRF